VVDRQDEQRAIGVREPVIAYPVESAADETALGVDDPFRPSGAARRVQEEGLVGRRGKMRVP
jgi:hypothetical protein